jgi:large subunit ribosomal protein L6
MKAAAIEPKEKRKQGIKVELTLPDGISASVSGNILSVKGPKGESKRVIKQKNVSVSADGDKLVFETSRSTKKDKKMANSLVAHAKNMMKGAAETHAYILKICAGHFPITVTVADKKLSVKNFLGEKVPRVLPLKDGATVKVEGVLIHVTSVDKEIAGQVSAGIEQLTRRPGFDSRVFQDGIFITNKDGKELK